MPFSYQALCFGDFPFGIIPQFQPKDVIIRLMRDLNDFLTHRVKSFQYALEGIFYSAKDGINFKIHIAAATLAAILGIIYKIDRTEWIAII